MFWQGILFGQEYSVWDDKPGGKVVDRYRFNGVRYVVVEFENSPGVKYVYLAE